MAAVLLLAAALSLVVGRGGDVRIERPWLLPALAGLVALEHFLSVRLRRRQHGETVSHEEALLVLMAMVLPPASALLAFGAGTLAGQLAQHSARLKAVFNVGQLVGSAALALLVVDVVSTGENEPRTALAALLGVVVFSIANRAAVVGVLALTGASSFRDSLREDLGPVAVVWLGTVSVGLLGGLASLAYAWALPFALAAMAALSVAFSGHARARRERQAHTEIVRSATAAIFSVDQEGSVRSWNPEMARITGLAETDALGASLGDLVRSTRADGRGADLLSPSVLSEPDDRKTVKVAVAGGGERWLRLSRATLPDGGMAFVAQDVTELRETEKAVRESEARLRLALEAGQMGWWEWDIASNAVHWSESLERLNGLEPGSFGGTFADFVATIHPDDRESVLRASEPAFAESQSEIVYRIVRPDGAVRWIEDMGKVLRDEEGRPVKMIGVERDITERKTLEASLLQAQKMDAVGRLAGGIAHDFNNLMSAVVGFGDLALRRLDEADPVRAQVEQIVRAGERAAAMTNQLLAFSRKQMLQPRLLDLNAVVADSDMLLRRLIGEDIELTCALDHELEPVLADPIQLEQVIVNLAVNARDAMPTGGKLTIETGTVEIDGEYAASHFEVEAGRYVMLAVSDTGMGMDPETQTRIFEPFFTTKREGAGTGLGLATVFGIVKQSGGYISVYSEPEQGTTFKLFLPPAELRTERTEPRGAQEGRPRGTETILLVEDEELVRDLERQVLQECGYLVLEAADARLALEVAAAHDAPIHLLLTDVVMPGMSGRQLVEQLSPTRPETKILYASGYADDSVVRHGVLEAEVAFLTKPFTPRSIAAKVREVLDADPHPVRDKTEHTLAGQAPARTPAPTAS